MGMVGRMAGERDRAFTLLAEANMQTDSSMKTEKLKLLVQILLDREPGLLTEFVPRLMELQMDPSSPVLKYLADCTSIEMQNVSRFEEKMFQTYCLYYPAKANIMQTHHINMSAMLPTLLALLRDNTPAVARRAISSGTNLFRNTLEEVALQGIYTGQVDVRLQEAWACMLRFKDDVYPAAYQHANDGVRLQAIKFVETTILLFTPDPNGSSRPPPQHTVTDGAPKGFNLEWIARGHPVLDAAAMGQEASKNLGLLVNQLRPFESSTLPGPVAIVLVNSLATVAKKRPSLFGRVLPVLLGLAPNFENIKGGQVTSVIHAPKNSFLSLLKCTHSGAGPWRERLVEALRSMNVGDVAESTLRQIDRAMRNAERARASRDPRTMKDDRLQPSADASRKRSLPQENGNQAGETEDSNGKRLRAMHNSGAMQSMQGNGYSNETQVAVAAQESGLTAIQQMISMFGALVAQGERAAASVDLLIANIAPDMLTDIVIANMIHLPSTPPQEEAASSSGISVPAQFVLGGAMPSALPIPSQVPFPVAAPLGLVSSVSVPSVMPSLVIPAVVPPSEVLTPSPADGRRDPRRDPRRMDPRLLSPQSSVEPPTDVNNSIGGVGGFGSEPPAFSAEIKHEAQTPASFKDPSETHSPANITDGRELLSPGNSRDPRASLQHLSSPRPLLAKVKPEPVDVAPPLASQPIPPLSIAAETIPPTPVPPIPQGTAVKPEPIEATESSIATHASSAFKEVRGPSSAALTFSAVTGGIPVSVPVPTIPVVSLTDEQQVALGKAALVRILEGHKTIAAAGGDSLRIALLARWLLSPVQMIIITSSPRTKTIQLRSSQRRKHSTLSSKTYIHRTCMGLRGVAAAVV